MKRSNIEHSPKSKGVYKQNYKGSYHSYALARSQNRLLKVIATLSYSRVKLNMSERINLYGCTKKYRMHPKEM